MTDATYPAALRAKHRLAQVLRNALGEDFAITNSGIAGDGAWFLAVVSTEAGLAEVKAEFSMLPGGQPESGRYDCTRHRVRFRKAGDQCGACLHEAGFTEGATGELVPPRRLRLAEPGSRTGP